MILPFDSQVQAEWAQFVLQELPYYDERGKVLTTLEGRKNQKGVDEFYGGGKIGYPMLEDQKKAIEWYEKGLVLLINGSFSKVYTNSISLKNESAEVMKTSIFKVPEKVVSGVTK